MVAKTENQKPKTENPAPRPKALVLYGYKGSHNEKASCF